MSSTPKRFTRYEAEFHAPDTKYVLAEEHDAEVERYKTMSDNYCALGMDANATAETLRAERNELARLRDALTAELAAANATLIDLGYTYRGGERWKPPVIRAGLPTDADVSLALYRAVCEQRDGLKQLSDHLAKRVEDLHKQLAALSYPVYLHTNPLLTVESGGIRYVLEVISDEDGEWFEVKSATPTEAQTLDDFASSADAFASTETDARKALAIYRAAQREDDEASRAE